MAPRLTESFKRIHPADHDLARIEANVAIFAESVERMLSSRANAALLTGATLDELLAAIALKLDASAYNAADVLAKLLTVDGVGSGLDADQVDGKNPGSASGLATLDSNSRVIEVSSNMRVLDSQITAIGNVGAGEDNLMSYSVPGGTLSNNGDTLLVLGLFTGNNADTARLRLYFGATALTLVGSGPYNTGSVGGGWAMGIVVRTGAATQKMGSAAMRQAAEFGASYAAAAETLSGAVTLKFTGENITDASNNAIVQECMMTLLVKAA